MATGRTTRLQAILLAGGLSFASVLVLGGLQARPRGDADVAAIFPPWTDRQTAFLSVVAAGGRVVREGALDTILIVQGDDTRFIRRLYAAGAWAVADPRAFGGCLTGRPGTTT